MISSRNSNNKILVVLVTGASGFLATHCIQQLLSLGYRVRGTVRSLKNSIKCGPLEALCPNNEFKKNLELVEADLENPDSWKRYNKYFC